MTKIMSGFDYVVQSSDTIEKIAARYDCTPGQLMKFNKLTSRMLFSGQKIRVPDPDEMQQTATASRHSSVSAVSSNTPNQSSPIKENRPLVVSQKTSIVDAPYTAPCAAEFSNTETNSRTTSLTVDPGDHSAAECSQKFLKLKVKHFTDSEGVVAGVLLVTPNCVMFDPDVMHPLVVENGPDKYSMVAFMDVIVSAALYKELPQMMDDNENNKENNNKNAPTRQVYRSETTDRDTHHAIEPEVIANVKPVVHKSNSSVDSYTLEKAENKPFRRCLSDGQRNSVTDACRIEPQIHFLKKHLDDGDSKVVNDFVVVDDKSKLNEQRNNQFNKSDDENRQQQDRLPEAPSSCPSAIDTDLQAEVFLEESAESTGFMPNMGNLKRLRRSWRQRANTLGGTLVQSTQSLGGSLVQGTQTIGGSLMQGTQAVGRTFSLGAKAVARVPQAVARVPQNLANISTGIFAQQDDNECANNDGSSYDTLDFRDDWLGSIEILDESLRDARRIRRQQQRDMLRKLKRKTAEMRESTRFTCITTKEEHPYLFAEIEDMLPYPMHDICTELPYYLCIRVLSSEARRRKEFASRHSSKLPDSEFGDKTKNEFWFTIPRPKADTLYAFLIQWTPDKYGENDAGGEVFVEQQAASVANRRNVSQNKSMSSGEEPCFVILDRTDSVELGEEPAFQPSSFPASLNLNREWEIVTVEEVKRRLSLLDLCQSDIIPLPDGCEQSLILTEDMVRQLVDVLPARAQGYPWVLVYSSEAHGFSLGTLYRNMASWHDELSPTLLVIRDSNQNVFGAVISCPLRLSDNFYGTGESLLYTFYPQFQTFLWKGANNFIAKGNKDGLAIGAGKGAFGLWLDSDFYRGRTQKCLTFDNELLTNDEDFVIAGIEAFGFRLGF